MEQVQGFDFVPLNFDRDGALTNPAAWAELKTAAAGPGPTDAIFIAHGFRNSEAEARALYGEFLRTFRTNMAHPGIAARLAARRFVVGGIFWPSKAFRETFGDGGVQSADNDALQRERAREQLAELRELARTPEQERDIDEAMRLLDVIDGNPDAQDEFAARVLSSVEADGRLLDAAEGFENIRSTPGSTLLSKLEMPIILPTQRRDPDEGGALSVDTGGPYGGGEGDAQGIRAAFGSIFGRVGEFLNLTTWYLMKARSGTVGETGVAACVRELKRDRPGIRVHLVGHSLGGRLMAACAKALAAPPAVRVQSLTLLQAAFSHFGLSADNRQGTPGFFRDVIEKGIVEGPMVATFSFEDTVVGKAYAIASRLAGDNVRAVGDANDPFGGIGRNGAQNLTESVVEGLHGAGTAYTFRPGVVHCLDGSGGLITNHGDVENETVTWAFASAVAGTA